MVTDPRVEEQYVADGIMTVFPVTIDHYQDQLAVLLIDLDDIWIPQTKDSDWAYLEPDQIEFLLAPPPAGYTVVIQTDAEQTQELDLIINDPLPPEELEGALDKLTLLTRQSEKRAIGALTYPDYSDGPYFLPTGINRVEKVFYHDAAGEALFVDPKYFSGSYLHIHQWEAGNTYSVGYLITYAGEIWRAVAPDPATAPGAVAGQWDRFSAGLHKDNTWLSDEPYSNGEIIVYNKELWLALAPVTGSAPGAVSGEWTRFSAGLHKDPLWLTDERYVQDEIVNYRGVLYRCSVFNSTPGVDPSLLTEWDRFSEGLHEDPQWFSDETYTQNEIVNYQGTHYVCTVPTSTPGTLPDLLTEWDIWSSDTSEFTSVDATITSGRPSHKVFCDTTGGDITITLQNGTKPGDEVTVVGSGGNDVDVIGAGISIAPFSNEARSFLWAGSLWVVSSGGAGGGGGGLEVGEVTWWTGPLTTSLPSGKLECDGSILQIADYNRLYAKIGDTWGGDGITTFALPDLQGISPGARGTQDIGGTTYGDGTAIGGDREFNASSGTAVNTAEAVGRWVIQADIAEPTEANAILIDVELGNVRWWPSTAPINENDLECNGQIVNIADYPDLFNLLTTEYGGDGITTFGIPDLRSAYPGMGGINSVLGNNNGGNIADYLADQFEEHTHVQNPHTHTQNSHNHTQNAHTHTQNSHTHTMPSHKHLEGARFNQSDVRRVEYGMVNGSPNNTVSETGGSTSHYPWRQVNTETVNPGDTNARTATNQNTTATNQAATAVNQNTTATNQTAGSGTETRPATVIGTWIIRAKQPDLYEFPVLTPGSITEEYLADEAVSTRTIEDGAVTEAKLATGAVTTDKLGTDSVTTAKLAPNAVDNDALGTDAVQTVNIANGQITTAKLVNGSVTLAKLASEVLNAIYPVGYTYAQYPGGATPASMGLPGTWTEQYQTEGVAFRTPGGQALAFNGGIQEDAMQKITGNFGARGLWNTNDAGAGTGALKRGTYATTDRGSTTSSGSNQAIAFDNSLSVSPNPAKTDDVETRMRNRTFRIWRRTS